VRRQETERGEGVHHEVAVPRDVQGIGTRPPESQGPCQRVAVHENAGPRNGARAQRAVGQTPRDGGETLPVPDERPRVRLQDVGPPHGLRTLPVRIAGQDQIHAVGRPVHQHLTQGLDLPIHRGQRLPQPEAEIRHHLVVARPARIQLPGDRSDLFVEQPLDQGVDILVRCVHRRALAQPPGDALESPMQRGDLVIGEHAGAAEPGGPGLGDPDVLRPHALIDRQAAVQPVEGVRRGVREPPAPHVVGRPGSRGRHGERAAVTRAGVAQATGRSAAACRRTSAPMRTGRPKRRMKPPASAWL